ncbi:MAG: ABC transporter permease subunit, partial [Verrucomicrobiota bacterium]
MRRSLLATLFYAPSSAGAPPVFVRGFNALLLLGCVAWASWEVLQRAGLHWDWEAVGAYWKLFAAGWGTTVGVSIGALALSTVLGVLVALAQRSRLLVLRYAAQGYVELVRGTPLLAQIYILFYIVAEAVRLENRTVAGILTLSIFS